MISPNRLLKKGGYLNRVQAVRIEPSLSAWNLICELSIGQLPERRAFSAAC